MSDDSECSTRERENARDFFDGRGANIQSMGSKRERDSREPRRKARGKRFIKVQMRTGNTAKKGKFSKDSPGRSQEKLPE
ncbi:Hypothetical predicted protein [Xyrichtys novacula]|uniref:Uncharacterized protein n=1 Tax=Xyrichtys novacula TaxID=13765 RepID=A0AAV1G0X5_XYRNO|nr:Hypothetical predicted protein [Xyrichtys novacula]